MELKAHLWSLLLQSEPDQAKPGNRLGTAWPLAARTLSQVNGLIIYTNGKMVAGIF
jgi:hypothetical protein